MMLEKVKMHVLWLVAVILGFSGYSRAQDPAGSLLEEASSVILPEIDPEMLRLRSEEEEAQVLTDPFKVAERFDMSKYAQQVDYDYDDGQMLGDGEGRVPVVSLESTLSFGGRQSAYFDGKRVSRGNTIVAGPEGGNVTLLRVDTLEVVVEYLGVEYNLHLHESPRLQVGRTHAAVMGRKRTGGEEGLNQAESAALEPLRETAAKIRKAQKEGG